MYRTANEKVSARSIRIPVAAETSITEGTMVAINSSGYAVPAAKSTGLTAAGCAVAPADNLTGAAGDVMVEVHRGAFVWDNDSTSIAATDILKDCYFAGPTSVTITSTGSSVAGKILAVDPEGVTVEMAM